MDTNLIIKYLKKFGAWVLFPFSLLVAVLFWLCIIEYYDTSGFFPDFMNIKCGCYKQETIIISLQEKAKNANVERDNISKELAELEKKLHQTSKELAQANNSNNMLIAERDSLTTELTNLESRRQELLRQLEIKDSIIIVNEQIIDSMKRSNPLIPHLDSGYVYVNATEYDSLKQIHDIISNVFVTDIQVLRINDTQIKIDFKLKGINTLKKYYKNEVVMLQLKVFDDQIKNYIELVEKNPINNSNKNQANSVLIKFEKAIGDEYADICYFSNTQDKPFKRGLFNVYNKKFNIQFFFPKVDRPLSYYPSKLNRRMK